MAQRKIDISLTIPQFEHVKQAVRDAQDQHHKDLGRANPSLTAAQKAFDKAEAEPEDDAEGEKNDGPDQS